MRTAANSCRRLFPRAAIALVILAVSAIIGARAPADTLNFHDLKFFLHPDLVGSMSETDLKSNLSQYADDLNLVFSKQTNRRLSFDPDTNITITAEKPHSDHSGPLPLTGYELWVHAVLTDNPTYGTYGGYAGLHEDGQGVAAGLKWDAIHNPSALTEQRPIEQYWRQIDHVVHEFEHVFGAGSGEYYNLAYVNDTTGVDPLVNIRKSATDPYWGQRQDYFTDPLLNNIHNLDLVGSPTSLQDLRDTVGFADVTVAVVDLGPRVVNLIGTVPDLSQVNVEVIDADTGLPISDATVRTWNVRSFSPYASEELTVSATGTPGLFQFAWDPYPHISIFGNYDHLKSIKAFADGYEPAATWVSLYDAQYEKLINGNDQMTISVSLALIPEPSTLVGLIGLGAIGLFIGWRHRKRSA